jgi:uncharacterized protein YeaO (DUF488 family)
MILQERHDRSMRRTDSSMMDIRTKRVYESADPDDGFRVLVDRVWPRGMTKEQVGADLWLKDAAPDTDLRKWFGHDPARWEAFRDRYFVELDTKELIVARLLDEVSKGRVTLLFSARDEEYNQAVALREYLISRSGNKAG